ncbi:argininosuccinate synthase [Cladochytrium replicatum]|nr:argininosuccinate synthase [Cladochytrium replicatum]
MSRLKSLASQEKFLFLGNGAVAYSGGLDTSCILAYLIDQGYEVMAYMANIGQEEDYEAARKKAISVGASAVFFEDLRREFLANCLYEGVYLPWKQIAKREGCDFVAHGCTGKGNDKFRFELAYYALNPAIKVIAPWRDEALPRRQALLDYAASKNIPVTQTKAKPWSTDENMYHISFEAGILEDPATTPPKDMWKLLTVDPEDAPNTPPSESPFTFEKGVPVKLVNHTHPSTRTDALDIFLQLNALGRAHGIGRPGGTILREAHVDLEGLVLDREFRRLRDASPQKLAELIYNGFWYSPEREFMMAGVGQSQATVNGTVKLKLYKGSVIVEGRTSRASLYDADIASMDVAGGFNSADSTGFIKISIRLKAAVSQKKTLGL